MPGLRVPCHTSTPWGTLGRYSGRRHLSRTADLAVSPQFHVDKKGRVNFAQTELLIHVVNRETNRILDVERYVTWPITQPIAWPVESSGSLINIKMPKQPFSSQGDSDDRREQGAAEEPLQELQRAGRAARHHRPGPGRPLGSAGNGPAGSGNGCCSQVGQCLFPSSMALRGLERCFTQIISGGCPPLAAGSVPEVATTPLSLLDGNHRAGRPALPGCHALHPHELVLPDSVSNARALPHRPQSPHGTRVAAPSPGSAGKQKAGHQLPNTFCGGAQPGFRNCPSSPKI